ncbi:hypothetical protein Sango_2985900 [Sesamum angolense]|uniref:Zinc knuckle CX2CX4HX4C domain-containing protein n=1 Tax=Sesamum angolense TaxID=2727404 RepID=A0AAE1T4E3_9LAMI|nr:hypothetical protein Sango_2985900 [Sesamum angolense]
MASSYVRLMSLVDPPSLCNRFWSGCRCFSPYWYICGAVFGFLPLAMDSDQGRLGASLSLAEEEESGVVFLTDRDWVLDRCPWAYGENLIVLAPVEAADDPNLVDLNWCDFHIHIHGLPLGKMTQDIVVFIENRLGRFKESGEVWGSYVRVRVALDVTKPLKRALKIHTVLGDEQLISFTYERLPNF